MPEIDPNPPNPVSLAWNKVASYDSYEDAQDAVDRPSNKGFPVEHLDIIGIDLRLVEHVTGRFTKGRAAAAGPSEAPGSVCSPQSSWNSACPPVRG
ncbi:general stress protein [Streptomyces sp. NPDC002784]